MHLDIDLPNKIIVIKDEITNGKLKFTFKQALDKNGKNGVNFDTILKKKFNMDEEIKDKLFGLLKKYYLVKKYILKK